LPFVNQTNGVVDHTKLAVLHNWSRNLSIENILVEIRKCVSPKLSSQWKHSLTVIIFQGDGIVQQQEATPTAWGINLLGDRNPSTYQSNQFCGCQTDSSSISVLYFSSLTSQTCHFIVIAMPQLERFLTFNAWALTSDCGLPDNSTRQWLSRIKS